MKRRVVVTGLGLASPIGNTADEVVASLRSGQGGIETIPEWERYRGMFTRLGARVKHLPLEYPRKSVRTMGRVSLLALHATDQALAAASLDREELSSDRVGVAYGSTHGSSSTMERALGRVFGSEPTFEGMASSSYPAFMSHTTAANLAIYYGIRGRVFTTCSACTSGSQGIGYAYEAIRDGSMDLMVAGGAEELHAIHAGIFDVMYATSTHFNDRPDASPRPYDTRRDGLVVGEGAGTLLLEPLERALARGATVHAELVGFGTNCDGLHVTAPSVDGMAAAMELALRDAGLDARHIDYVNGHGTATELGDIAETVATARVFGRRVPISSTKSFTGHTLGACGAIESIVSILALQRGFLPHTIHLDDVDPRCGDLDYVREFRDAQPRIVMNNNFAFGGINTSLVFRRWEGS